MSRNTFPIKIRDAVASKYETVGKLHALAFAHDMMYRRLYTAIPADALLQWMWIDGALTGVRMGQDRVLVLEREDTKDIIGLAWLHEYSRENEPILLPESWCKGLNKEVVVQIAQPRHEWQMEVLQKYGDYLCTFLPLYFEALLRALAYAPVEPHIDLREFAIHPDYQSLGLGRVFMAHLASLAKNEGLSAIALTADAGTFLINVFPNILSDTAAHSKFTCS
jgi:GNAT superfamily N-acetyltransferase